MKAIHRAKTLAAYEGARVVMATDNVYASYMLLKEAARGVLAYIVDDRYDYKCTTKTKLHKLLGMVTEDLVPIEDQENIHIFVEMEDAGLETIMAMDMEVLKKIKKSIKHLIGEYMREPV